jgi:hypothetical protein
MMGLAEMPVFFCSIFAVIEKVTRSHMEKLLIVMVR